MNADDAEQQETPPAEEAELADQCPRIAQMVLGWVVAAVVIFLAQRDIRKRPPELVRGPVGLWKAVAMAPPGAVAYLLFGRRRAASPAAVDVSDPLAA